jgi:hypothetical protein
MARFTQSCFEVTARVVLLHFRAHYLQIEQHKIGGSSLLAEPRHGTGRGIESIHDRSESVVQMSVLG